jgi:serine/threonine protein kinase
MKCLTAEELIELLNADDHAPGLDRAISHLVDCHQCADRYDSLAQIHAPTLVAAGWSSDANPGTSVPQAAGVAPAFPWDLPNFQVIRRLGQGGMGEVYLCQDLELNRPVAVKAIPLSRIRPEFLARQRREANLQASLNHPNIISVYAFDVSPTAHPYIVMEYVEGITLSELIRKQLPTSRTTLQIMLQVARAVAFSHAHQVLHRDLKPSNILLKPVPQANTAIAVRDREANSGGWFAKIADFGLARLMTTGQRLTASAGGIGTPAYLAPESVNKAFGPVGVGTDIYALGVILYECLTGRPPFLAESVAESIRMIQEHEPPAPRHVNPAIPHDLEAICLKCMEKEPQRRYQTAAALADDLERFQMGLPILARPIGQVGKTMRWCSRNRRLTAALATSALSLILLGLGGGWFAWQQNTLRRAADEQAAEARRAQAAAQRYSDLARNNFMASLQQIHVMDRELRDILRKKPHQPEIEQAQRLLESQKQALADTYLSQSMKSGESRGFELDRIFKDARTMDDIGLRASAMPVLEQLVKIAEKPMPSLRDEQFRLSVGMKSSTMLAIWLDEQCQRGEASSLLRQAWHQWPLDLGNAHMYPDALLLDRAILDGLYLSMIDTRVLADEAKSVEQEMTILNQLIQHRAIAKKTEPPG